MKINEIGFGFADLTIDLQRLNAILGYPDSLLPAPFDEYLDEALEFASHLTDMRAAWRVVDKVQIDPSAGTVMAGGQLFQTGKTVCKELGNAGELLFYVCTAGRSVSQRCAELMNGDDPAKGYIYDQVGIFLAEAIARRLQHLIKEELAEGKLMTNMYSPGYCHWDVSDQHRLFALFPHAPCGVTLTDSALMNPVKSVSGVIGIGETVSYREYPCALCLSLNCIYRQTGT